MKKTKELLIKYRGMISYMFFGGCATVVNLVVYWLCHSISGVANVPSTIIAWFASVIFAFITNKLFVFESKSFKAKVLAFEAVSFFGFRALTGLIDVAVMYVTVDLLQWNPLLCKLLSNVIVVVLNYVASKLLIFKNANPEAEK